MTATWKLLIGDVRSRLCELPDVSVQCCVTSPPYWGLRDYGHAGQIGLEATPDAFVEQMVVVFREVRRVLADDGVLWLNLGDSYASDSKGSGGPSEKQLSNAGSRYGVRRLDHGLKSKDLVGIPWRVAFALQADGWYLRSDVIWSKPNPMPESVTDRPTKSHEYIFLLTKGERYFYDADAIAEQVTQDRDPSRKANSYGAGNNGPKRSGNKVRAYGDSVGRQDSHLGRGVPWEDLTGKRNARTVWPIATQPYPEAHFATFPEAIPERCIKAGSRLGDTVLDPFTGSGTTGQVALQLGRSFVGIELNPQYAELARARIGGAAPLFTTEVA